MEKFRNLMYALREAVSTNGPQLLVATLGVYIVTLCVYRLWFHPLASIPGPRLAAVSDWWLVYQSVFLHGNLPHVLPELHKRYGRVIRLSPNEVHIYDSELYNQIYRQNSPFLKAKSIYNGFGFPAAIFAQTEPALHKPLRDAMGPLFSKKAVDGLENLISDREEILLSRIGKMAEQGTPISIKNAFYCCTLDVISAFCFGESLGMLNSPGFESEVLSNVLQFPNGVWIVVHFPLFTWLTLSVPRFIGRVLAKPYWDYRAMCEKVVREFQNPGSTAMGGNTHTTLFEVLSDPERYKANHTVGVEELVDEAMSTLTGGTDSTATTLSYATYNFITHSKERKRLLAELDSAQRSPDGRLTLETLRQLPYLTAFIKETLRYNFIIPGRLVRVVPPGGLIVPSTSQLIPAGATVGIAHVMVHRDPGIWGDPDTFNPERWLSEGATGLDRYIVSFSKGSRSCLGINLAWAELLLVLGNLFSRFELELYNTTEKDMGWTDHAVTRIKGKFQIKARKRNT